MAEVGGVIERSLLTAEQLEKWLGGDDGEDVQLGGWQKGWKAKIEKRAKGVVLIIAYVLKSGIVYEEATKRRSQTMELSLHPKPPTSLRRHCGGMLCTHQTLRARAHIFRLPRTYPAQIP